MELQRILSYVFFLLFLLTISGNFTSEFSIDIDKTSYFSSFLLCIELPTVSFCRRISMGEWRKSRNEDSELSKEQRISANEAFCVRRFVCWHRKQPEIAGELMENPLRSNFPWKTRRKILRRPCTHRLPRYDPNTITCFLYMHKDSIPMLPLGNIKITSCF